MADDMTHPTRAKDRRVDSYGDRHRDPRLSHVDCWVFDLDNTLYPASCRVFDQVDVLIRRFIEERLAVDRSTADALRKRYWYEHGTTMNGLMAEHGVDPEEYMNFVHRIDYSIIPPSPQLAAILGRLEGPKYIFTNANVAHAETVLARIGIRDHFEVIFDITAASYQPKPRDHFYDTFLAEHGVDPAASVLVEDLAKNLKPAHARGMTTVLVETDSDHAMEGHDGDHVHHRTDDLAAWLDAVVAARSGAG